jgi:glutaconate CoA-transferase, subunit B
VRWLGAFGSACLYFVVPRVILFRDEHTRRVFVPKVDFVSAPRASAPNVYRPGGAHTPVTNLCIMRFDRKAGRFRLESVRCGRTLEGVRDNAGFDFDVAPIRNSPGPCSAIRRSSATRLNKMGPAFAGPWNQGN